jgi:hypothetical protein
MSIVFDRSEILNMAVWPVPGYREPADIFPKQYRHPHRKLNGIILKRFQPESETSIVTKLTAKNFMCLIYL